MRIYVDFDDCLCETGRAFSKLVLEMFHKRVPYDQMHYFELDRSFAFAKTHGAELTVMEEGEHWFHTDEQMRFLDNWIMKGKQV